MPGTDREHVGAVEVAAQQGADPREELVDVEGLGQVVLGAGVETGDAVSRVGLGREHQDRHRDPVAAQAAQEVEPLHGGEPAVEDRHVVGAGQREVQAAVAVGGGLDVVALLVEEPFEHLDQVGVVLDQQQPRERAGPVRSDHRHHLAPDRAGHRPGPGPRF